MTTGRVLAVSVVGELRPQPGRRPATTAIDKRPVDGRVPITRLGVAGDQQVNRKHHGGPYQAVYAFAREDVLPWEVELGRAIAPGGFGENLTTEALEVSDAVVGERWRIGGGRPDAVVMQVTAPRTPCGTFERWMGEPDWTKRFATYGRTGSYLRVITEGTVGAGDPIEVVDRPAHGVTVGEVFRSLSSDAALALRDAHDAGELDLAPTVLRKVARRLGS